MAVVIKALLFLAIIGGITSFPTASQGSAVISTPTAANLAVNWNGHRVRNMGHSEPPASNSSSIPSHHPKHCGEYGNFTLKWDDEPLFNPSDSDAIVYPPVFNPYHHLFFSNGYAYAPPPEGPYQPISKPHMAVFLPNATSKDIGSPSAAGARPGELGSGPRASTNAYWFNAYGAYLGCENGGPRSCSVMVKGFKYNAAGGKEVLVSQQKLRVPPCSASKHCHMRFYRFDRLAAGLSGLQISAHVDRKQRIFFMDNLQLGWYNDSCEAGLLRLTVRK